MSSTQGNSSKRRWRFTASFRGSSFPPQETDKNSKTGIIILLPVYRLIHQMLFLRDTILHIEDKETLFANFLKWLKPGGKLMISGGFHN